MWKRIENKKGRKKKGRGRNLTMQYEKARRWREKERKLARKVRQKSDLEGRESLQEGNNSCNAIVSWSCRWAEVTRRPWRVSGGRGKRRGIGKWRRKKGEIKPSSSGRGDGKIQRSKDEPSGRKKNVMRNLMAIKINTFSNEFLVSECKTCN